MKTKRLLNLLGLIIATFLFSCREEVKIIENHKEVSIIEARKNDLNFEQFKRITSKSSSDVKLDLNTISHNTTKKINFNDFRIDTTFIKKTISDKNKTTFSIRAYKKGENPRNHIYNIVYHLEDNEWIADLIKFSFREEWLFKYQQDTKIPFWGKSEHLGSEKIKSNTAKLNCIMSVQSLCYCADHKPGECRGCETGFRNVLLIECSESGGDINSDSSSDWINVPPPPSYSYSTYNDINSGGSSLGGTEFDNNPASIEDLLYKEEVWKYDLQQAIGNLLDDYPLTYYRFENYHLYKKGQNIAFIGSLVTRFINNKEFLNWASFFLLDNKDSVRPAQFENWFVNGYSENFKTKLIQLTSSEVQEYITINREIDISPYQEEYIKETNEAFVAFAGYADIETMTDAQIEYVLNNNCCAGLFIQYYVSEKVKTIKANYKLLKKLYPSWGKGKIFWHAARDTIHLFLDIAGTVPVIGEVCDLTNGVIYTIEGDALNATLSYAGTIPIAGWGATGAKMAIKTVAGGISLAMIKNADGFYVVSRNQQLFRKVLGMAKGDARIAHHIIPFAIQTNPVVQKAMFSKMLL